MNNRSDKGAKILVVDDDEQVLESLRSILEGEGYAVIKANNAEEGLKRCHFDKPDMIISDLVMPGESGIDFLMKVTEEYGDIPFVIITGYSSIDSTIEALKNGAFNYLIKPIKPEILKSVISKGISISRLSRLKREISPYVIQKLSYRIPTDLMYYEGLLKQVGECARAMGICKKSLDINIRLAITEAVLNAMEHGNKWNREKEVIVEVEITHSKIEIKVKDEGEGFDHNSIADPTLPENLLKTRGRGIFLIKSIMDEVRFNEKGNVISMLKRLDGHTPGK